MHILIADEHVVLVIVDGQVLDGELARLRDLVVVERRARVTDGRADARKQLLRAEGLGQIIVRACVEGFDLVALVAAGGIFLPALAALGVSVGTHIKTCAGIADRGFEGDPTADIAALTAASFPVLDAESGISMERAILAAKADGDSVGGVTETAVAGMPGSRGSTALRACSRIFFSRSAASRAWNSARALPLRKCAAVRLTIRLP